MFFCFCFCFLFSVFDCSWLHFTAFLAMSSLSSCLWQNLWIWWGLLLWAELLRMFTSTWDCSGRLHCCKSINVFESLLWEYVSSRHSWNRNVFCGSTLSCSNSDFVLKEGGKEGRKEGRKELEWLKMSLKCYGLLWQISHPHPPPHTQKVSTVLW